MTLPFLVSEPRPREVRGIFFPSWPALFRHLLKDCRSVAFRLAQAPTPVLRQLDRGQRFACAPAGYQLPADDRWIRLGVLD